MKIVFLGNFSVPFSTESHHKWTWEKLGHEVVALQENKTPPEQVVEACKDAQVFSWTHTHGWICPGKITYDQMLEQIHAMGVRTFSYHLDVYYGLNKIDRREDGVGKHPAWHVQNWFSTDGDHEEFFKSRGVNHHWLQPAVVEYGCFMGTPQEHLKCDIAFVGSVGYHPEYPFRKKMVDALRAHYGDRFRVLQGYREQALNDLYASVKVLIGDHCFAGAPHYWSDRVPETCGRGGFLLCPFTGALDIPCAFYTPQDIDDLIRKTDYYLAHDAEREEIRRTCFEYVRTHSTYTHRLREILKVIGMETAVAA